MKILLADDERMVRVGLISMLEELYPEQHTYFQAANGKDLLQILVLEKPDLVFVDIKMPELDGLSALEQAAEIRSDTKFLILSGYSDFSFAQSAIRLNVSDYLLKPVSLEILKETVDRVQENLYVQRKSGQQSFASTILRDYWQFSLDETLPAHELPYHCDVYLFYFDQCLRSASRSLSKRFQTLLESHLQQMLMKRYQYALFYLTSGELCLLTEHKMTGHIIDLIGSIMPMIYAFITAFRIENISYQDLFSRLQKIRHWESLRFLFPRSTSFSLNNPPQKWRSVLPFAQVIEQLWLALSSNQLAEYQYHLDDLQKLSFPVEYQGSLKQNLSYLFQKEIDFWDMPSFCAQLEEMKCVFSKDELTGESLISQIQCYVSNHYMEDIGVNHLADLFGFSPNYLSRIYHQQSGMKLTDFITKTRIENAKRLFRENTALTVRDVSQQVGYYSARYFSKVFLKHTGKLPSEYLISIL